MVSTNFWIPVKDNLLRDRFKLFPRQKSEKCSFRIPDTKDLTRNSFTGRRIIHLQNPSKLTEKQLDKVRRIVYPKLRPSDGLVSSMFSRAFILFFCSFSSNSTLRKLIWCSKKQSTKQTESRQRRANRKPSKNDKLKYNKWLRKRAKNTGKTILTASVRQPRI